MDHPIIKRMERTGHPQKMPEPCGIDAMGSEIFEGDSIVVDTANDEKILEENLEDYLIEHLGFRFKTAE